MKTLRFVVIVCLVWGIGLPAWSSTPGVRTPGFWKNSPEAWPVDEITIGGQTYVKEGAIGLIRSPVRRDMSYTMFRALVAAKLNVLIGNDDSCIAEAIAAADQWMADYPVGSGISGSDEDWWIDGEVLMFHLDQYNNGFFCAGPSD